MRTIILNTAGIIARERGFETKSCPEGVEGDFKIYTGGEIKDGEIIRGAKFKGRQKNSSTFHWFEFGI